MLRGPNYRDRTPEQIISEKVYFDSVGHTYRSLSWLDIAKRESSVCALQYAAMEIRLAIEQLFFEEIVLSVGTKLDREEYNRCRGNGTKLHKIIRRLNPDYNKLAKFTKAVASINLHSPPLIIWDHKVLMKHWGKVSNSLHWHGAPKDTAESTEWIDEQIGKIETASNYIWEKNEKGFTGIMTPEEMRPEIRTCWEQYRDSEIDLESVKIRTNLAFPIIVDRINYPSR